MQPSVTAAAPATRDPSQTSPSASAKTEPALPAGGLGFDWAAALLSILYVGGLFLDGWAHSHGRVDQSFFTPWHAVFYAGFAAVATLLVGAAVRSRMRGRPWRRALPAGYGLSLVGVAVFAAGGVGDLVWHELFGIEKSVEALLSPTHLLLALGLGLIVSGPLRGGARRRDASGWARVPVVLSLAALFSLFTFFTMYAHPLVYVAAGTSQHRTGDEARGVVAILLQSGLLAGVSLVAVRVRTFPIGGLTWLFLLNTGAMGFLHVHEGYRLRLVLAAGAAGLVADLLRYRLAPGPDRPVALRLFAAGVPGVFYLAYFLALMLSEGIAWSVHAWTGAVALAGTVGWLLSYLVVPPRSLEAAPERA